LAKIEEAIYGSDSADSHLPTPQQIIEMLQ